MRLTLEPTTVASEFGDSRAKLVSMDGRLIAVLARLGQLHGDLAGRWFVEAAFGSATALIGESFATLDEFEAHIVAFSENRG